VNVISHDAVIASAEAVLNPHTVDDRLPGVLHVVPPCGRCREFIRQIDRANLDTEVVLGRTSSARPRDLLPRSEWPQPTGQPTVHPETRNST